MGPSTALHAGSCFFVALIERLVGCAARNARSSAIAFSTRSVLTYWSRTQSLRASTDRFQGPFAKSHGDLCEAVRFQRLWTMAAKSRCSIGAAVSPALAARSSCVSFFDVRVLRAYARRETPKGNLITLLAS